MNVKFEKILNYEYIIDIINKMIQVIYDLKKKKWEIEFEWDLYWNIIDYRFFIFYYIHHLILWYISLDF